MSQTNAFKDGYRSFFSGVIVCPYKDGTHFAREWLRGFNSAYYTNLSRTKKIPEAA